MTSEKDDEILALSMPPGKGAAPPVAKDEASTIPKPCEQQPRDFTQAFRILGTFCVFFITWGGASSFGAYQAFYQRDLLAEHTPSVIAWIGTVQISLMGFTGIVSGALYDRGYIRALLIVGGALVVFGFMMLSLAKEYYQIILAQGICIGLGTYSAFK